MENNISKNETEKRDITPPYLSVIRLEKIIDLASNRNFTSVSPSLFEQYGFSRSDAILAANTFKFLGLTDENGQATELMSKLHLHGEKKKEEFEKILRAAYTKLFKATNDTPHTLSKDDLSNEFAINYKLTPRVVEAAIPAFIKLCEYAGLKEEGSIVGRKRAPKSKKEGSKILKSTEGAFKKSPGYQPPSGMSTIPFELGKMSINIPAELHHEALFDEKLGADLRELLMAAKKFSDKHIKEETSEENSEDT